MAVNLIPFSEEPLAKFRGPASSSDYNLVSRQQFLDIVRLYNLANQNNKDLKNILKYLMKENYALQLKINQIFFDTQGLVSNKITAGFYSTEEAPDSITIDNETFNSDVNMVQTDYGQITLPLLDKVSKVHLYDIVTDKYYVPEDISVKVDIENSNDIFLIEQNDLVNIIDGRPENIYMARIGSNSSDRTEVRATITITFPPSLAINTVLNTIELKALIGSFAVSSIEYLSVKNEWTSIDSALAMPINPDSDQSFVFDIPSTENGTKDLISESDLSYNCLRFKNVDALGIRVNVTIRRYYYDNGIKIWDLIIKDIDASYCRYARKGIKYIVTNAPGTIENRHIEIYREAFGKINVLDKIAGTAITLPHNIIGVELISDQSTGATPVIKKVAIWGG